MKLEINALEYKVLAVLDYGYVWSDGTHEDKEISCGINKKVSDIVVSNNLGEIMKEDKTMGMAAIVAVASMAFMGYKYMMCHPEAKKSMKETLKSATKKIYQKFDDME